MAVLTPQQLYRFCDPLRLPEGGSESLADLAGLVGQDRAKEAMDFGLAVRHPGYNLFALGPAGIDIRGFLKDHLDGVAAGQPTPADWCYVNNFVDPQKPLALKMPPGRAAPLREDMRKLVAELRAALPAAFESDDYRARREVIDAQFKERGERDFNELQQRARERSIALVRTPMGLALAPMREGEVLNPEAYHKLPEPEREKIKADLETLQKDLEAIVAKVPEWERQHREEVRKFNRDITQFAVGHLIDELRAAYAELSDVLAYLQSVELDILENAHEFLRPSGPHAGLAAEEQDTPAPLDAAAFRRYQVNVLVDGAKPKGAPVIYEDNPTHQTLVGRIEHFARFGALVTDFALLRAGALHRANGGYLLLDAIKLLTSPFAWESLKRALRASEIRIESLDQMLSLASTVSLEPQSIPLDVKVVLIGEPRIYYLLCALDPEFDDLFKVALDFEHDIAWTQAATELYARMIATEIRQRKLLPFDRGAIARVIERTSRLAGDSEKLSAHTRDLFDLLVESSHRAGAHGAAKVSAAAVEETIAAQIRRADRVHSRIREEILRGTIGIETAGARVGQINGLSVISMGGQSFGQPSRITARFRLGKGEVIDIEREATLGGPLHSKGILILGGFLGGRYSTDRPLALRATLVFEQSYGGVDGDSASMAELCALLSALAEAPIRQSFAMTGSVDQNGRSQAIGGVNEKIEGYFDICRQRGLDGSHGVIVPATNVKHLMLRADVVEAVRDGRFSVHAIDDVDEAIEILTGLPAGAIGKDGRYPPESVNGKVAARLAALAESAAQFSGAKRGGDER